MDNYNNIIFHENVENNNINTNTNTKFVCKYEILIEQIDDYKKEFEIAKRIIGPKGKNMKEIFDKCVKLEKSLNLEDKYKSKMKKEDKDKEVVKLRLRGRGSGQKENNKRENNETLHLCISSKYEETFDQAKNLVEDLINKIFIEYKIYADKYNLKNKELLQKYYDLSINNKKNQNNSSNYTSINTDETSNNQMIDESLNLKILEFKNQLMEIDQRPDINEIQQCIEIRNNARRNCNFQLADEFREILRQNGVAVMDEKGGRGKGCDVTTWKQWRPF